jgi:hypothetical protein
MHQPRITDRTQHERQIEPVPQDRHAEIAGRCRHGKARLEDHFLEGALAVPQGHFVIGGAVEIIEHRIRQPGPRQIAQILDVDDAGRSEIHGTGAQKQRRSYARKCQSL